MQQDYRFLRNGKDVVDEIIRQVQSKQNTPPFDTYSKIDGDLYIGHANGITSNGTSLTLYSINPTYPYKPGMGLLKAENMVREKEEWVRFRTD